MGLSKLASKCQTCPYVLTCDHKQMELYGYLSFPEVTPGNSGDMNKIAVNSEFSLEASVNIADRIVNILNNPQKMKGERFL